MSGSIQGNGDTMIKKLSLWQTDGHLMGVGGLGKKGEGIKMYKLPATKIVTRV